MITRRRAIAALAAGACWTVLPGAAAVPLATDRRGRLIVPVLINDRGPFRFVLDTAAEMAAVSTWLAAELRLPGLGDRERLLHGSTASVPSTPHLIGHFQFDEISRWSLECVAVPPAALGDVDGILGADSLAGAVLDVDLERGSVCAGEGSPPTRGDGWRAAGGVRWNGALLSIDARLGSQRVRAILDTGAQRSIGNEALRRSLVREALPADTVEPLILTGVDGSTQVASAVGAPLLRTAGITFAAAPLWCADLPVFARWGYAQTPAMLLGMDRLARVRRLVVDYARGRVWLLG